MLEKIKKILTQLPPRDKTTDEEMYMIIQKAAEEQTEIGWFNLLQGRMSKSWEVTQDTY